MKVKSHMIISSSEAGKAFDKIQYPFIINTPKRSGIKGPYLNVIKAAYSKLTANINLNGKNLKALPLKSGTRQVACSLHSYSV